ncbi:hypothetical protein FLL45_17040 [Aliikangiella marina]|uniref:Uncharacterized protein n=1 Tax=Aliikangiella marina TaxID=1712262 RepID=A0A545T7F6_9GAMM|nr:hypothetical protein [Aliikangiella marina]TQV73157.1 hypothetical protein FLL45_17040 [Aliikangiella marina]
MQYSKVKVVCAFLVTSLIAFLLASIFHTQFVLKELIAIGVEINFGTRLATTIEDIVGLAPGYGAIVTVGLLIGFTVMALIRKYFHLPRYMAYALGGGLAFAAMHWLMYPIFYITLIAGARTNLGFIFQCLAGVIGGLIFARLLLWARGRSIFHEPKN